jgi:hypothetical protein
MGVNIQSSAGPTSWIIDPVSFAGRVTLYGANGQPLQLADTGAFAQGAASGLPIEGHDGPVARVMRVASTGNLRSGSDTPPLFYDSIEGISVDTNKWVQTLATMTIAQTVAVGTIYNNASAAGSGAAAMQVSAVRFPFIARNALLYRGRARMSLHSPNNLIELGFGAPATASAATIGDGACWRKDGTGQWVPVLSFSNSETLGTPISDATFRSFIGVNEFATFEVFLEDSRCTFRIFDVDGSLVNEQYIPFATQTSTFSVTRLAVFARTYNSAAVATGVIFTTGVQAVWYPDQIGPDYTQSPLWNCNGSLTSPTTFAQLASFVNNTVPTTASLSNTAAAYPTPGGLFQFAAPLGSETDNIIFGWNVPTPLGFTMTRITIDALNTGAAVATTPTSIQWGIGVNSSAVSLLTSAPNPPMRKALGLHSWPVGALAGSQGGHPVVWQGKEKIMPGRWLQVIARIFAGTATASQIIRGTVNIDGFFE